MHLPTRLLARILLSASVGVTLYFALRPSGDPSLLNDKVLHAGAFAVLAALTRLAFPNTRWVTIVVGLTAFGCGIELVQGLSIIGRDREFFDAVADFAGTLAGIAAVQAFRTLQGSS